MLVQTGYSSIVLYYQLLLMNGCLGVKYFHCHNWQFLKYFFISFTWLHLVLVVACRMVGLSGVALTVTECGIVGPLTSLNGGAGEAVRVEMTPAQEEDSPHEKWEAPSPSALFNPSSRYLPCTFIIKNGLYILWFWFWEIKDEDSFMLWRPCCLVTKLCPTLCDPLDCSPPGSSVHGQEYWSGLPFPSPESLSFKIVFFFF